MISHLLAAASVVAWLARLVLLVRLHVGTSGYHPVRHAVSDYGVGATRGLASLLSVVTAVAWLSFAGAAALWIAPGGDRGFVVACAAAAGAVALAMPFVPTDLEGERLTRRGVLHYALAVASFGLAYAPMGNLVRAVRPVAPVAGEALGVVSWVALAALIGVCVTLAGPGRRVFGLVERVYLGAVLAFYLVAAGVLALTPAAG